MESICKRI